jgi:hypothetical protein
MRLGDSRGGASTREKREMFFRFLFVVFWLCESEKKEQIKDMSLVFDVHVDNHKKVPLFSSISVTFSTRHYKK